MINKPNSLSESGRLVQMHHVYGRSLGIALLVVILLAGCAGNRSIREGLLKNSVPGKAELRGCFSQDTEWNGGQVLQVFAAPYHGDHMEGFYLLEPNIHPHASLDRKGCFVIISVPPGSYVLVAGSTADTAKLAVDPDGSLLIVRLKSDQALSLDGLFLAD